MSALTQNIQRQFAVHTPQKVPLPAAADAVLFTGALVCVNTSGFAVPGADETDLIFMGVCWQGLDNSGGAAGTLGNTFNAFGAARTVEVDTQGEWEFAFTGATPKPGQAALIVNDYTVSADATTNGLLCGMFTRPATPGSWFVDVERR